MTPLQLRAHASITRALGGETLPALRSVSFSLSEDHRQLDVWSVFDTVSAQRQVDELSSRMTDVYAEFAWPERGDPVIVEHVSYVDAASPLPVVGTCVYARPEPPLPTAMSVALDPDGAPIGVFAIVDGVYVPLAQQRVSFGRTPDNDVALVGDPQVSRRQFVLEFTPLGVLIADTASASGTWVDGQQITRRYLREGAVIVVGARRIEIVRTSPP